MKIRTNYNRTADDHSYSKTEGDSLTVPNEAYTIREIYERSAGGLMSTQGLIRDGYYPEESEFDDVDLEKISRLDFTEIQEEKLRLLNSEISSHLKKRNSKVKGATKEQPEDQGIELEDDDGVEQ